MFWQGHGFSCWIIWITFSSMTGWSINYLFIIKIWPFIVWFVCKVPAFLLIFATLLSAFICLLVGSSIVHFLLNSIFVIAALFHLHFGMLYEVNSLDRKRRIEKERKRTICLSAVDHRFVWLQKKPFVIASGFLIERT